MKLNFTTLIYFKKIVKHKNITKAAKEFKYCAIFTEQNYKKFGKRIKGSAFNV